MPRFVVLDHSLTCVGGHNYEQAVRILRAAHDRGFDPVLVANRRFRLREKLPSEWQIIPVFEHESRDFLAEYPLDMEGAPLKGRFAGPSGQTPLALLSDAWSAWRCRWQNSRRHHRLERFAGACMKVHQTIRFRDRDQVFIPTTSLFDLLGVVRWVRAMRTVPGVQVHGLFHYGFLQGREPDYHSQAECQQRVRRQLEYLLRHVPEGQLRLYGITEKLAQQYNRLGLIEFGVLPFPVDIHALQSKNGGDVSSKLRLTCAGYLRREKGKVVAGQFVSGVWREELDPGRIQLVVQTNRRQARRMVPAGVTIPLRFCANLQAAGDEPIVWLRHPLSREAYTEMIHGSDAAIFLHDGQAYYTRCSGVLVEMLAAGVPVLVPAGSWLADQVSQPIYEHLDNVRRQARVVKEVVTKESTGRLEHTSDSVHSADADPVRNGADAQLDWNTACPHDATSLLVSFPWCREMAEGTYVRLVVEQFEDRATEPSCRNVSILGAPRHGTAVSSLFQIHCETSRVRISLGAAYTEACLPSNAVSLRFLAAPETDTGSYPAGKVGLIFADVDQLPALVRDIREHYAHYRASARQFAESWRKEHDAGRIVDLITETGSSPMRAVA